MSWHDGRLDNDIFAQRFDAAGHPLGANFQVDDAPTGYQMWSSVAMDDAGNFVITWYDWREGSADTDIYAKMYDVDGTPVDINFRVNDDFGIIAKQEKPSVAMDPEGGRFVIHWTDYRDADFDTEIRAQFYDVDGHPVGGNVEVNEPDPFPYDHQLTEWGGFPIACRHDTVLFAWQDNRRHKGWDIYATLSNWLETGIEEDREREISIRDVRAHPNPFRSCITIHGAQSEFNIYDVSGRLIGRTKNGLWDGKDTNGREAQSGVYFLKAKSSGSQTLKVIKLK